MTSRLAAFGFTAALFAPSPLWATEFYAHPLNAGAPTNLPGETLIPGLPETLTALDTATRPLLQPLLAPDGATPAAPGPVLRHGHRHHHGRHKVTAHLRRHTAHRAA